MEILKKKVEELIPADYNPRKDLKPGDAEYEKLKRSIKEYGYVEPVIIITAKIVHKKSRNQKHKKSQNQKPTKSRKIKNQK